jgi:transcriptional regulator with XRE-family HTH domain
MEQNHLAKKIKELRSRKGFSQEELAEKSGLSLRTIQRIENGETIPRGDTLNKLTTALNVSPDELLDWQVVEDKGVLLMLNMSQLGILAFPLLGIIIPMAIWTMRKDTIKGVNEQGISIINFQITWIILVISVFLLSIIFLGPQEVIVFAIVLYIFNVVLVFINLYRVSRSKEVFYHPRFAFLK